MLPAVAAENIGQGRFIDLHAGAGKDVEAVVCLDLPVDTESRAIDVGRNAGVAGVEHNASHPCAEVMIVADTGLAEYAFTANAVRIDDAAAGIDGQVVNNRPGAQRSACIEARPVVGRCCKRGAPAILCAEAVIRTDVECVRRRLNLEDRAAAEVGNHVVAVVGIAVLRLQGPVAGYGRFHADAQNVAAAVFAERYRRTAGNAAIELEVLPSIAAKHVGEGGGSDHVAEPRAGIETIAVGELDVGHRHATAACLDGRADVAEMSVDETAEKDAVRQHVVVAGGDFAEHAFATKSVDACRVDAVSDLEAMHDCTNPYAGADICTAPVEAGRRFRRKLRVGSVSGRPQNQQSGSAQ